MKIQVIAIFYNAEQTIKRCLDSILSQDVGDNLLEIIAIDDCSQDDTRSLLEQYSDAKVKKVFHEANKGISAARNSGLHLVDGDCFYLIDGDDYLPPKALATLLRLWENDVDWVQGAYRVVSPNGDEIMINGKPDGHYCSHAEIESHFNQMEFIYTHNRLVNAKWSVVKFVEGEVHEDRFWNVEVFPEIQKIITISEPTYNYVSSDASFSGKSRSSKQYMKSAIHLMQRMLSLPNCWSATRELFLMTTIYKNLFLFGRSRDVAYCWSHLDRNFKVSIDLNPPFPRFPVSVYRMISAHVPDVLILAYAKIYKIIKRLMKRPI